MKKLFETLETLKPQFIERLNTQLFVYTTIGSGTHESPMWIQMDSIWADVELKFSNSQKTQIAFYIPVDKETQQLIRDYRDECYNFFKYVKYMHIKEVAPTVWDELATGFNGARIHSFMDSYKPLYVKPTVQQLINDGMITLHDVMLYAREINDKVIADSYVDYYEDDYYDDHDPNEPRYPEEEKYGDYLDDEMELSQGHIRSDDPEYIVASTSYKLEETYIFESNEKGEVVDLGEYGGLAKRWGDENWLNYYTAVDNVFGEGKYRFDRRIESGISSVTHILFKRIDD